jgi:chitin synthase
MNAAYAPLAHPVAGSGRNTPAEMFGSRPASRNMLHGASGSRPATAYLDMGARNSSPIFDYEMAAASPTAGPSDHDLEIAVRDLLRDADLNTVTKRAIREKLQTRFGVDLGPRKATINSIVDKVLLSQT